MTVRTGQSPGATGGGEGSEAVRRAALAALTALVLLCCAETPDPLTVAEHTCRVTVIGSVNSGKCDKYPNLLDCPEYAAAMAECGILLRAAAAK